MPRQTLLHRDSHRAGAPLNSIAPRAWKGHHLLAVLQLQDSTLVLQRPEAYDQWELVAHAVFGALVDERDLVIEHRGDTIFRHECYGDGGLALALLRAVADALDLQGAM
eukprot:3236413-Pyramimonas_sp.AAC.2